VGISAGDLTGGYFVLIGRGTGRGEGLGLNGNEDEVGLGLSGRSGTDHQGIREVHSILPTSNEVGVGCSSASAKAIMKVSRANAECKRDQLACTGIGELSKQSESQTTKRMVEESREKCRRSKDES